MWEQLEKLEEKYDELNKKLQNPLLSQDYNNYQKIIKDKVELEEIVQKFKIYKKALEEKENLKEMLKENLEQELKILAERELEELIKKEEELKKELNILLQPKDPKDSKNVIMEIRAGTGGEEASLFASDLFRMYSRYAERKKWKTEIISSSPTGLGGFKEIIFSIFGSRAYSRLKWESGVHRVQRIPVTEAGGRIHTSAATVAVLPEAEEIEVKIKPEDLRIDTFRASGAGGQHVNKTSSAVRITHLPTGIVVSCQDERSQHQNKEKALRLLRTYLLDKLEKEQQTELSKMRKEQVRSGDRSEKIRTYNFPQERVTDHRIGLSLHQLSEILDGNLDKLIDGLIKSEELQLVKYA